MAFKRYPSLNEVLKTAGCGDGRNGFDEIITQACRVIIAPECREVRISHLSGEACFCLGLPLDINLATIRDLEYLPGIGPVRARRIVRARELNGPFTDLEELRSLGIYSSILLDIGPMVTY